ncbi:MAG: TnsD family Tn7-like transposition protein [Bacillota bacterium]
MAERLFGGNIFVGNRVTAILSKFGAIYQHNPFIESLPPVYTSDTAARRMRRRPRYNEAERRWPAEARQTIANYLEPLPIHTELERRFSRMIRNGYMPRNPISTEWKKQIRSGFPDIDWGSADESYMPIIHSTAAGFHIIGTSGVGKSTVWLDCMEKFPEKTKTELRRIAQAEYTWLYRHDRLWLDEHSPATAPKKGDDRRVDWKKRDAELAALVAWAAGEIKQQSGKRTRLTVSSIGKKTGKLALLQRHLSKLPETRDTLENVIETEEDFQIHRVRYIASQLRERGELVRIWKIVREAGLRPGYSRRVAEEIHNEVGKE